MYDTACSHEAHYTEIYYGNHVTFSLVNLINLTSITNMNKMNNITNITNFIE
ncbi:hypothetical protein [Paenibacillus massiliensis]|uniref:hypothetical protein n=1 Tax=Paenibacillus massiliensis TaxID=225917 RepID=UPI00036742F5|nr:hypothetical protein [Paenibacillus massiliensis]